MGQIISALPGKLNNKQPFHVTRVLCLAFVELNFRDAQGESWMKIEEIHIPAK